jgi:hypothetical protein
MRHVWLVIGSLVVSIAAITPAVRLERARPCETVVDGERGCILRTKLVDAITQRPDGTPAPAAIREQVLVWQIEEPAAYELDVHPSSAAIRVEDSLGQTVSEVVSSGRARTRSLAAGAYRIYVSGAADTPRELVLAIVPS